jgi:hypothetical protein
MRGWIAGFLLVSLSAGACGEVTAHASADLVAIENATQRLAWKKNGTGRFLLTSCVRDGDRWRVVFDGNAPLVEGSNFDLHPTVGDVVESTALAAVVELRGVHPSHGYEWSARFEAKPETSWIDCRVVCRLRKPIVLAKLEPQVVLWCNNDRDAVCVDQGPGSIYKAVEHEWGNSFPAAYRWQDGAESAIFFDAGAMDWMSPRNLFRFRDCRVQSWIEDGRTGFGLRVVKRNFHELPAGEIAWSFSLHSASRANRPTRLEALDRLIRLAGPRHPSKATPMRDRIAKEPANWTTIAHQVNENLMLQGVVWKDVAIPADAPWRDNPAFPEHTVSSLRVSTDYAVDSACDPATARKAVGDGWDFSTCNNYLAGWLAHNRLHASATRRSFLEEKVRSVPLFFDPNAQLFRHGTRHPRGLGPKEMSWQNFAFAIEVDKLRRVLAPRERDPALAGKFLRGADTLAEFARGVNYLFPQWFDPITKAPLVQGDEPELGIIKEPWQAGSYAWMMCSAHEISGDPRYLTEACSAVDRLFGGMRFRIKNARYDVDYTDPVDFPITEIFGNAWGVAAGMKLHALTGDARYLRASDDFLNSLLRLTYWYESNLRDDPRDGAVRSAALFRNHSGAYTGSPWENGEVYLALTARLRADFLRGLSPREPLLRMFNVFRRNAATFFPPTFAHAAQPCARVMDHAANYLPIEDTYTLEHGGRNGGMGRAAYMSGIAFWNEVMFEALAQSEDPEILVLNLDAIEGFGASVAAIERHFTVYNPTDVRKAIRVQLKKLSPGKHRVSTRVDGSSMQEEQIDAGEDPVSVTVNLPAGRHALITVRVADSDKRLKELAASEAITNELSLRYKRLQIAAKGGMTESLQREKAAYLEEVQKFRTSSE